MHVVLLFNLVVPDTFNELLIVVILFNVVIPDTFNYDDIVALIAVKLYALTSYNPELFILQFIYYILV